jgi:hypothetical protein
MTDHLPYNGGSVGWSVENGDLGCASDQRKDNRGLPHDPIVLRLGFPPPVVKRPVYMYRDVQTAAAYFPVTGFL